MTSNEATRFQKIAWILSLLGLVPFVVMAGAMLFAGSNNAVIVPSLNFFKTYSAVVLCFMGGIRWGLSLNQEDGDSAPFSLVASIIPAMVAGVVILLPDTYNQLMLMILLLCYCALGAWDSLSANARKLPKWYGKLRIYLTLLVAASHIAVFLAIGGAF